MTQTPLGRLAEAAGIVPQYHDIRGVEHPTKEETARIFLGRMGLPADTEAEVAASLALLAAREWGRLLQPVAVVDVDLVAVAVALGNLGLAVDGGNPRLRIETRGIGAEPHRAAKIALGLAFLERIALEPFRHQTDHRFARFAEFRGGSLFDTRQ